MIRFLRSLFADESPEPVESGLPDDIDEAQARAMESIQGTRDAVAKSLRATRRDIVASGRISQRAHVIAVAQSAIEAAHKRHQQRGRD